MNQLHKLLVALDGSPRSDGVLAYATSVARLTGAKLILLRVFVVPPDLELAWPLSDQPLEMALEREARAYLEERARAVPPGVVAEVRAAAGTPWATVCAIACSEAVDLIVIGAHGYTRIDRLLGTTAARIVNHADRPVLVVRAAPTAREGKARRPTKST